ncbi:protein prickle isoform X1 [Drosophila albomicans]|uniref:Protein prickle isoform X1 n=1 Tax=Drosophila albomicans TaxID=7291 RepID=A0A9C6WIF0_DROAB|nr:protein prickle isoform X1 [Drosophila albomicans]
MNSKVNSLEEKVKLPPTETISRCYQPQQSNRKVIRILTVAVYVLCVSLAAIMLSLYYIFIWDPTIRPFVTKANQCDKIVIPEKIAIRLLNSSEVTAEQFYRHILDQYRILNHLQQQRQQFLQKQHLQLQQLEASNRFQEVFATATIIQAHPHPHSRDPLKKLLSPGASSLSQQNHSDSSAFRLESPAANMDVAAAAAAAVPPSPHHMPIVLDTSPPGDMNAMSMMHLKRKTHRGHYKHHRSRGGGGGGGGVSGQKKPLIGSSSLASTTSAAAGAAAFALGGEQATPATPHGYMDTPLNPAAGTIVQQPQLQLYTSMPIPLILSPSNSEKRPMHHSHSHVHSERRGGGGGGGGGGNGGGGGAQARRRTTTATVSGYDAQTYLNPFLTGELIFEK